MVSNGGMLNSNIVKMKKAYKHPFEKVPEKFYDCKINNKIYEFEDNNNWIIAI